MNSLAVAEAPAAEAEPKFSAFTGTGRRLDGKSASHQPQSISSSRSSDEKQSAQSAGSSSQNGTRRSLGKLVFGQNAPRNPKEAPKVPYPLCTFHHPILNQCFSQSIDFQETSLVKGFFAPIAFHQLY